MPLTCESCGAPLPPEARFCPRCGTPVRSAPGGPGERKLVTVLFADLVESTELSRRLDQERAREVLGGFYELAAAQVASARGQVEKFIGDAVMAVFGLPRTHEDDALRAVRTGLALVARVGRLGAEMGLDPPLQVRVGIASGEAATGDSLGGQHLVTGSVVNVAARLQAAAAPGEVLIGSITRRLIGDAASVGDQRRIAAKGFGDVTATPVTALARRSVRRTIPLVGRRSELALLQTALDRMVHTGRPHLATVVGEAGMGKSRLIEEFRALLPDSVVTLVGRADAYGGSTPLGPAADALRRFAGLGESQPPDDTIRRLTEVLRARCDFEDVESLARRLGQALGIVVELDRDEATAVQDAQRAFATLVFEVSTRQPVVLVLDDLHFARGPMLDLAERLVARTRGRPPRLLVVAGARPDLFDERPAWGQSAWNHMLVRLEALAGEESVDLARQAGGARLGDAALQQVASRTGGNPFFIVETTGMLLDTGAASVDGSALPPTVQAVVAARLDALPAPLRELAHTISVFLDACDLEELSIVAEPEPQSLAELEDAEILTAEGQPQRWRFRHRILHDVAYAAVSKRERLRLHLAVADGLAARGRYGVADHLERAAIAALDIAPGDRSIPDRAVDALIQAGDRARRRMESRRAVDRYRRALALAGPEEAWGVREAHALAGVGEARYWLSEYEAACDALRRAEQLGLQAADDWTLAVALRFLGDIVLSVDGDLDRADEIHARSLQAAERLADPALVARSLLFAGWVPWTRDRFREAESLWRRALTLARENRDRWVETRALSAISVALSELEEFEAAGRHAEEAMAVARDLGDQFSTAVAMVQLGRTIDWRGDPDAAVRQFTEAAAIFEEMGARWELADALYARGSAYAEQDRLEDAETDLRAAVRISEEVGARVLGGWTARALGRVRSRREEHHGPSPPAGATTAVTPAPAATPSAD
jgi:class 3 adenylate cyclase/tetratricopeptide (TPR) repeat protein